MIDNKGKINFDISYNIKLFQLVQIHYMISHMTNYVIIKFMSLQLYCTYISYSIYFFIKFFFDKFII